ncbi:hypothetical protein [Streptacidiphilus carbonis]|uniref:hypothetical protein n=1 Tax=Streptacidiphilus carbonis TaxID=105422 RepID=UPI0005A9972D|nr:hypothetical protein [Streptacidiphilus carbonis]
MRVVPAGRDLDFGHQIRMKLTSSERCLGLGSIATGWISCKSVTDGNQPQNSVGCGSFRVKVAIKR